ncbi:MAG: sulfatase-like hydrolase/transferase [Phycisphaera sp.]|nr:sulfatase-like hydrolase/transferase [Phycisphaera sp.]
MARPTNPHAAVTRVIAYLAMAAAVVVVTTLGPAVGDVRAAGGAAKPNIIFILTDDLGYGDVGAFFQELRRQKHEAAEPWHFTPHLDAFAAQGMQLRDNYTAAPVCAPSRSSLLTGVTQGHAVVRDNQFDKEIARNYTLGSTMKGAGYATAAFGKWGLQGQVDGGVKKDLEVTDAHKWPGHPLQRGFDYYFGYIRHVDGHFHYPQEDGRQVWENYTNVADKLKLCYTSDLFAARCKKWIVDHVHDHAEQPFFIYLAFDTPHAKLQNPPCPFPDGAGLHGGLQWIGEPGHMINTATGAMDSYEYPDYADATWDDDHNPATPPRPWPDVNKRYATDVRRIDDAVGDLMQLLKDLKIDDNTVLVFTSDNGPSIESYLSGKDKNGYSNSYTPEFFHSYGPFDGIKRDCWEGGVRMPTMARWPGHIPAGAIDHTPCGSWDWLMTFADLAGLPGPTRSDGVSLVPALTHTGKQTPSTVYIEYDQRGKTPSFTDFVPAHRGRMRGQMQLLRFGDLLGVRYDIKSVNDPFEIYNVTEDPQQAHNLADEPDYADFQAKLQTEALRQRISNDSAKRPYDDTPIPAVTLKHAAPGVTFSAFTGDWPWLPKFDMVKPDDTGKADRPDLADVNPAKHNGAMFTGYLVAPATGTYHFYVTSDGASFLRIHNCQVVDGDFGHKPGGTAEGAVHLEKGAHPFRLYYARKPGDTATPTLQFEWSGPGIDRQSVPADALRRDAE